MSITVDDVMHYLDHLAPFDSAEAWDNVGLMVGNRSDSVKRILLALDISEVVIEEAVQSQVNLIISHHPVIFKDLKRISSDYRLGKMLIKLIQNGVSAISAHTNLDVSSKHGINRYLADCYGLINQQPMSDLHLFGIVGNFQNAMSLETFTKMTKDLFKIEHIKYANVDRLTTIKKIAICSGASADFIHDAIQTGADLYVTSDVKYHEAQDAIGSKLGLVDVGHFESEVVYLSHLQSLLAQQFNKQGESVQVLVSTTEKPIFTYR